MYLWIECRLGKVMTQKIWNVNNHSLSFFSTKIWNHSFFSQNLNFEAPSLKFFKNYFQISGAIFFKKKEHETRVYIHIEN